VYGDGDAGEISVLDVDTGHWRRLQPLADAGGAGVPRIRSTPNFVKGGADEVGVFTHLLPSSVVTPLFPSEHSFFYVCPTLLSKQVAYLYGGSKGGDEMWMLTGSADDTKRKDCPFVFNYRAFHGVMMFLRWVQSCSVLSIITRLAFAIEH
jgi:hypothetical protein